MLLRDPDNRSRHDLLTGTTAIAGPRQTDPCDRLHADEL